MLSASAKATIAGPRGERGEREERVESKYSKTSTSSSNMNSEKIYVGHLPSTCRKRDLEDLFGYYGPITTVEGNTYC